MQRGVHCVPGTINPSHAGPEDGSLILLPQPNTTTEKFFDSQTSPDTWQEKGLRLFIEEETQWFEDRDLKPMKVLAESGDLILWDSRTVHWGG